VARVNATFKGLAPASPAASRIARATSAKRDTRAELMLRRAVWNTGLRFRVDVRTLPGRPDLVFSAARVAVFCDGDFWHGRNLRSRLKKLAAGHNASYWVSKISANVARDRRTRRLLKRSGWEVLRLWESEVFADPQKAAKAVSGLVYGRLRKS